MRVAITGANGQLGQALCKRFAPHHEVVPLNQPDFDLDSPAAVGSIVSTGAHLVIHPAAYTNVDGCARDPELAYRINGLGTRYVALGCMNLGVPLVYISTNEVFPGTHECAYREYDPPQPINAYGLSKLAGEQAVRELVLRHYIVRVAWLFGGERNFVRTMLRLGAQPPEQGIRMVADEVGSPTYVVDVAETLLHLIEMPFYGTYHLVNQGACSRYDLARAVLDRGGFTGVSMTPIALADYPRDSTPPLYSPLANVAGAALGLILRPWQEALAAYVDSLKA